MLLWSGSARLWTPGIPILLLMGKPCVVQRKKRKVRQPDAAECSRNGSGLMLAQLPVDSKTNEITVIPELLKLLDISGSIVTIDAVGTQTAIMEQIHEQGGHFALTVKKNQPEAYEEIHTFMDKLEAADVQRKKWRSFGFWDEGVS